MASMVLSNRKAPRIIARSSNLRREPYPIFKPVPEIDDDDDMEPVIINGQMVSERPRKRDQSRGGDEMDYDQPGPSHGNGTYLVLGGEEEVICEDEEPSSSTDQYGRLHLPGPAEEVESFPCRYCADRVFLTSEGLRRHTVECHPMRIHSVDIFIANIQNEWRRREEERLRMNERMIQHRLKHEAMTRMAVRQAYQASALLDENGVRDNRYENCRICGILINREHPTAMENHMRAHRKNDELREQLTQEYGFEFVNRLSCHECQLVFTDEKKLLAHAENTHVRRRKYVCKFCGSVCLSLADLNLHKSDVHGVLHRQHGTGVMARHRMAQLQKRLVQQNTVTGPPPLGLKNPALTLTNLPSQSQPLDTPKPICKTVCENCGLEMARPSLLIRHMIRVHNKHNFEAKIEMATVSEYKVRVHAGRVSWHCCDQVFSDRAQFLFHRRSQHPPQFETEQRGASSGIQTRNSEALEDPETIHGELIPGPDGSMHVMVSGSMASDQVYTLVMVDEDGSTQVVSEIKAQDIHQVMPEVREGEEQHYQQEENAQEGQVVHVTEEELQQLREQYGDSLDEMVYFLPADHDVLLGGGEHQIDEDGRYIHHDGLGDIIENEEVRDGQEHNRLGDIIENEEDRDAREQSINQYDDDVTISTRPKMIKTEVVEGTVCENCGLEMARPSLLIRHMIRVHNKHNFEAKIEMATVSEYKVRVHAGRVSWHCCDQVFSDRAQFLFHRRSQHPPQFEAEQRGASSGIQTRNSEALEDPETIHGELIPGPDGSMHVMVSGSMASDQVYTLVMVDEDGSTQVVSEIKAQDIHQVMPEVREGEEQHYQQEENAQEGQVVHVTEEELQQLREQYGDSLDEMVYFLPADHDVLLGGGEHQIDEDGRYIHHDGLGDIIENEEVRDGQEHNRLGDIIENEEDRDAREQSINQYDDDVTISTRPKMIKTEVVEG